MNSNLIINYCKKNNLFTNGDSHQYGTVLFWADNINSNNREKRSKDIRDIAVAIYICSNDTKTIDHIENDLWELLQ